LNSEIQNWCLNISQSVLPVQVQCSFQNAIQFNTFHAAVCSSQVLLPFPSQADIVVCFAPHRSCSVKVELDGRWSSLSAVILIGGNTALAGWHRYPPQIRRHKVTLTVNLKITGLLFWHNLFIYLFEKKLFIYLRMLNAMKKNMMHHIVYCSQDQKSRNLLYMLYPVLPT